MISIPGYCIPGGITMQKVAILPIFTTKQPKMGVNRRF